MRCGSNYLIVCGGSRELKTFHRCGGGLIEHHRYEILNGIQSDDLMTFHRCDGGLIDDRCCEIPSDERTFHQKHDLTTSNCLGGGQSEHHQCGMRNGSQNGG